VRALDERIICLGTNWGWRAATPAAGDYDGDGRPIWQFTTLPRVRCMSERSRRSAGFSSDGVEEATAAPANYLGRGAAELAVFNPLLVHSFLNSGMCCVFAKHLARPMPYAVGVLYGAGGRIRVKTEGERQLNPNVRTETGKRNGAKKTSAGRHSKKTAEPDGEESQMGRSIISRRQAIDAA
jgi:hypothetical protein